MKEEKQNKSHVQRVVKINNLVKRFKCGNVIARETLKKFDWNEEKAIESLSTQTGGDCD